MDLSIIIVSWNASELLEKCLNAVYESVSGVDFEVIVVDNQSTDGSVGMLARDFPQVRLVENPENVGFARANNQAIPTCRGRYILLLNSDAFLTPQAVEKLIQVVQRNPEIGIAGAWLANLDGSPQASHGPLPTLRTELESLAGIDKLVQRKNQPLTNIEYLETGAVSGACLLAQREVFEQTGLLDDQFFMFSEEVDLCFRAQKAGWKVVHVPASRVVHVGGGSTGQTPKRFLMLYQSKLQYFAKHYGPWASRVLWAAILVVSWFKSCFYLLLRTVSGGRVDRGSLWLSVARGVGGLRR